MRTVSCRKVWVSFLLFTVIARPSIAADRNGEVVARVEDKSQAGSPLEVSGEVSFRETVLANEVSTTRSELVKARNISDKPILLLVASLTDSGPRSSPQQVDIVSDNFFKDEPILPGQDVTLWERPMGEGRSIDPFRSPTGDGRQPNAEFRLLYVQFANGSTFGDLQAASSYLGSRESNLLFLKRLDQSYRDRGESGLLETLEHYPATQRPEQLWNEIREQQRTNGTEASVVFVRHLINNALQHQAKLQAP